MTGCDHDDAVLGLFRPHAELEYYVNGVRARRDAYGLEAVVDEPVPPTERRIVGVVACYFCGKRADGLTSNDTPSCANCRALPPRKR